MQTQKSAKSIKEYDQKEFAPCDIKLILLGDSAVGKSKYFISKKKKKNLLLFEIKVSWEISFRQLVACLITKDLYLVLKYIVKNDKCPLMLSLCIVITIN